MTMITAFLETGSGDFKLCRAKNNTQAALSATNCSQCHKLILRHRPVGADGPVKACLSDDGRPRTQVPAPNGLLEPVPTRHICFKRGEKCPADKDRLKITDFDIACWDVPQLLDEAH
uniref:Uncharacterized protein n=1 Tax=Melanopsichium pennsylvanicum 4 TaxID=1398559 RepID=A0A077R3N3_9BASI|nr:uncharacterized protein BN887_06117 [Melanopsichium pennsylvanicum 4]